MRTYKDFEDFLQEKHAEQYGGLDDEMPDNCSDWISDLSVDALMAFAESYARNKTAELVQALHNYTLCGTSKEVKPMRECLDDASRILAKVKP